VSGSTQLLIVASRPLGGGSEYSEASEGCSLETGSADFALFEVCGSSPRTNERLRKTAEFLRGQTLRYPLLKTHPPRRVRQPSDTRFFFTPSFAVSRAMSALTDLA